MTEATDSINSDQPPAGASVYYFPAAQQDRELDFVALIGVLSRRKGMVVGVSLLFALLATGLAFYVTPVYEAKVLMSYVSDDSNEVSLGAASSLGGLARFAGLSPGQSDDQAEAIAILGSRAFSEWFIERENLMPVLFADQWNADAGKWAVPPEAVPSMNDAYRKFNEGVRSISQDSKTGLVTLTVAWTDPELAARWANVLVQEANSRIRMQAIEESEASIAYLERELASTSIAEVRQSIYRLIENQITKIMLANVREEYAFDVIDPAVASDTDDFFKPNRPLIVALGIAGGLMLAGFAALLADARASRKMQVE